jgi:hypothetical protein
LNISQLFLLVAGPKLQSLCAPILIISISIMRPGEWISSFAHLFWRVLDH